ncbi:Peptidase C14 caspase domain-containing protein [Pleurotus pulmonarius]
MVQPPPQVQPQPYQAPASYQLPNDGFLDGDHERYSRYPQVVHSEPPQHQPESRQRPYPRDDEYERRHGHHGYYGDRHDDRPRPQPEFGSSHSHNGGGHQPQQQQYSHQQDSHSPRPSSMNFRPSHNGSAGGLGEMAANFASGVLNNYVQGHSPRPHSFHNSPRPNNPSYPMNNGSGVYQGGIGGTEHAPPPGQLGLGDIASAFHGGSAAGNLEAMGQAIVDAYRYSRCTGRKKAVCIGINYIGSSNELKGCINDAWHVRDFLVDSHGFKAQDILMLTDDAPDPSIDTRSMNSRSRSKNNSRDLSRSQFRALNSRSKVQKPTKENILQAMKWLVGSPKQDDSLFFHYSGHGGRTPDVHGDEADGYDEVIYPVDHERNGHILDDTMHEIMMKCLPEGCRLTTLFDCCHSGTILDLPYTYSPGGQRSRGDITEKAKRRLACVGDIISIAGCADRQTSADTFQGGVAIGATSYAFLKILKQQPRQTYLELLNHL